MENEHNPYLPPPLHSLSTAWQWQNESRANKQRRVALAICLFAIIVSLVITALDDVVIQTRIGPWPIVFMSATLALLSSFLTRDRILAPLSCFGAIMCSAGFVAMTHDLQYAQLHIAAPLASAFSAPAFVLANWLGRQRLDK